jgi:GT2 family glycosyltransferase
MAYLCEKPFVSIIIPVKNAAAFLPNCLKSLNKLNYPREKYEVIISDSDSTDKTQEIATSLGAKLVIADGPSVCSGRNSGFKVARGEIIAFSDADCVMDRDWINNAVKYFRDDKIGCVGGPSLTPPDETPFGKACGFVLSFPLFTAGSTYGLHFNEAREVLHNPGCNAIYPRLVLEKVMPVDECFVEGEDVIMNKKVRELGYKFLFTPDTKLWHYRSSTPRRFWRQNYRYAIGRVLMWRRSPKLLNPLHILVGFGLPILFALLVILALMGVELLIGTLLAGLGFLFFFSLLAWAKTKDWRVALRVPQVIYILFTAWSLGFMKETFFPAAGRQK